MKWDLDWTFDFQATHMEVMVEGKEADVNTWGRENKTKSQVSSLINICIFRME